MSQLPPTEEDTGSMGKSKLLPHIDIESARAIGPDSRNIHFVSKMPKIDWSQYINTQDFPCFCDGYGEDLYYDEADRAALSKESMLVRENELYMRSERRNEMYSEYLSAKEKWEQQFQMQESESDQIIDNGNGTRYKILDNIGHGQFGTVYLVLDLSTPENDRKKYAVKVAKPQPAYRQQALHEVQVMQHIQRQSTENEMRCIIKMKEWFVYSDCLCIVNELLQNNLFEVLEKRKYKGLPLVLVQSVMRQLLEALMTLQKCEIVHSDIKPENIMIMDTSNDSKIKLIDYGSARFITQPSSNYIQSRYYRAPEVVLGLDHDYKIDIWSVGCVAFELFNGFPLFPGQNEIHLIELIVQMLGQFPPEIVDLSPRKELFHSDKTLKSEEEICSENGTTVTEFKHYFQFFNLDLIVLKMRIKTRDPAEIQMENKRRTLFLDILKRMLDLNPSTRISAAQALQHPFITSDLTKL